MVESYRLTDALYDAKLRMGGVLAYKFSGRRFDCGGNEGFMDASIIKITSNVQKSMNKPSGRRTPGKVFIPLKDKELIRKQSHLLQGFIGYSRPVFLKAASTKKFAYR